MLIDLQLHSNYSDGYLTPTQVVKFAFKRGIKIAALTDHNTVSGLGEFRRSCKKYKIKPITGLELYAKVGHKKINLLWYNFDDKDPGLHKILRNSQIRRRSRVRKILNKLIKKYKFVLNVEKTLDKYNHYIPLNHIIDEIWENGRNKKIIKKALGNKNPREEEIIGGFFYNRDIAVLHESYINIERILRLRKRIGGQIILNHPGKNNQLGREFIIKVKKLGFDGIEVMSPHHSLGGVMYAQFIAREFDFIATGSSDFHRFEGGNYAIQNSWDYFKVDAKFLRKIKKIIG